MFNVEIAKAMVKDIFPHITYEMMKNPFGMLPIINAHADKYNFAHGMFRMTIMPKNHNFVIKTGMNRTGSEQCQFEEEVFDKAMRAGMGYHFATFLGKFVYHQHTFYIFDKVIDVDEDNPDLDESGYMDEEELGELLDFCSWNCIDDIHGGNYGFNEFGDVVLCDYAGYRQWRD